MQETVSPDGSCGSARRTRPIFVLGAAIRALVALVAFPFEAKPVLFAQDRPTNLPTDHTKAKNIAAELIRLRKLRSLPPVVILVPEAEVERVILAWLRKQQPGDEAVRFTRALAALGCVPRELDLLPVRARILTRQIGGWFDAERSAVVIVDSSADPKPAATPDPARAIIFGLLLRDRGFVLFPPTGERLTTNMRLARESLLAGDASLTLHLFSQAQPPAPQPGADDSGNATNDMLTPRFLIELNAVAVAQGFHLAQEAHRAGGGAQLDAAYSWPPSGTAGLLGRQPDRNPALPAPSAIRIAGEILNGAAPSWDDELGQLACLAYLRLQNSEEDAVLGARGLVADRLLAWEAKGEGIPNVAWQTLWHGTEDAAAFEEAIARVIGERYGVVTRSDEGFAFSARGRHVALSRNRHSLGVLLLDAADAATLQTLATMLSEPQSTAK